MQKIAIPCNVTKQQKPLRVKRSILTESTECQFKL